MVTPREFQQGEVIIRENDLSEMVYLIERGRVEVTKEKEGKKTSNRQAITFSDCMLKTFTLI